MRVDSEVDVSIPFRWSDRTRSGGLTLNCVVLLATLSKRSGFQPIQARLDT